MKFIHIFFFLVLLNTHFFGQFEIETRTIVDHKPTYEDCDDWDCTVQKTINFILENMKTPQVEISEDKVPRLWLEITLRKNGGVKKSTVIQGFNYYYDEEVERVAQLLPPYNSAQLFGKKVEFTMVIPLYFGKYNKVGEVVYMDGESISEKEKSDSTTQEIFQNTDKMPIFPGCESESIENYTRCTGKKVMNFLVHNIHYPQACIDANVHGKVWAYYEIDSQGEIINIQIAKGVNPLLDAEVFWLLHHMPKHMPGEQDGKKVIVKYTIPVNFKIG